MAAEQNTEENRRQCPGPCLVLCNGCHHYLPFKKNKKPEDFSWIEQVYIQDRRSDLTYGSYMTKEENENVQIPFANCFESFSFKGMFKHKDLYVDILEKHPEVMPWLRMDRETGFFYALPVPRGCDSVIPKPKGRRIAAVRICVKCVEAIEAALKK